MCIRDRDHSYIEAAQDLGANPVQVFLKAVLPLSMPGVMSGIMTVSYTHLDVYKRQICDYVATGLTFDQAIELVRASSLYTVHTPVPAGHDYFDEGLFGKYKMCIRDRCKTK